MANTRDRSAIYGDIADTLTETCMQSIDDAGLTTRDGDHGRPSAGHLAYAAGELHRRRPTLDLSAVYGRDLIAALQTSLNTRLDLDNEIHRCFVSMGLGLFGPAGDDHAVLSGVNTTERRRLADELVATKEFKNNWEAFNGSILIGRSLLYGDPPARVLPHFEKIAAKYDETGYFDDTAGLGNYNNYGFMSINYPLRAAEFLAEDDPVRAEIDTRFKEHALRYVDLVLALVSPSGDTWPFGRSAGALGQLQCIALVEQCLSRGWLEGDVAVRARSVTRVAIQRMLDLYWDDSLQWFSFRDEFHSAYNYRTSHPMAWDLLRYFLQIEEYAKIDERRSGDSNAAAGLDGEPKHREIVTNPALKTAIYVWSDGTDHAVVPVMAGPHGVTGDSLTRPYGAGLFEWTTQHAVPALCPRITIGESTYWPTWHADKTTLARDGETAIYSVTFGRLYSNKGEPCGAAIGCTVRFLFSSRQFERFDTWTVEEPVELDFLMEVLEPAPHPKRPHFGPVHSITVDWKSEIPAVELAGVKDVSGDSHYRNYHSHPARSYKIQGSEVHLAPGRYETRLTLTW